MSVPEPQHQFDKIVDLLNKGFAVAAEHEALQCVRHFPEHAHAWFLLGVPRHMLRRHRDAIQAFDRALDLAPDHFQSLQAKAAILFETGRLQDALTTCEKVVALAPTDASALANLATALQKLDKLDQALHYFDLALAQDAHHTNALLNKGALLVKLNQLEEALANNRTLLSTHPQLPDAYFNLADVQLLLHLYEEALETCDTGIVLAPRHPGLHLKRGIAHACLAQFQKAQNALANAHALTPGILSKLLPAHDSTQAPLDLNRFADPSFLATSLFLAANLKAQEDCNWSRRDTFLKLLKQFIDNTTPHGAPLHDKRLAQPLLSMPLAPQTRLQVMRQISQREQATAQAFGLAPFNCAPRSKGRIRIGYLSPDFRGHSVGHLSRPLYQLHDRAHFEVHCYSLRNAPDDPVQQEIAAACDHWHDLSSMGTVAAAQRIHADGIDILVDLAGYTRDSNMELLALRPAPVQIHYLGYPGTSGAAFIDYIIADPVVCPEDYQPFLAEKPILLPDTYCLYDISTPNAVTSLRRSEMELPEDGFVFCCFNASYKIEPTLFAVWLRLLQQTPGSVLWLSNQGSLVKSNLQREAERQGVAQERLVFAPYTERERYLDSLQLADLFLDTRWHNAHTIAADALWQGLPVLTCTGPHWSSRLAASLLQATSLPELVTTSPEAYESLALQLAHQPEQLASIRNKLHATRADAPLFSPTTTVRQLEQAYQNIWEDWLRRQAVTS